MFENPSAGKFDPPPPPRDPTERVPLHKRWWFVTLLAISGYPVTHALLWFRGRGWVSAAAVIGAAVLWGLNLALNMKRTDETGEDNPYSPPTHLTR